MPFIPREEPFVCDHCGFLVEPLGQGTYRDHCPRCLHSKHVDRDGPGDRLCECKGDLEPIEIDQKSKKGFVIVHKCRGCGKIQRNRAAPDDQIVEFLESKEAQN